MNRIHARFLSAALVMASFLLVATQASAESVLYRITRWQQPAITGIVIPEPAVFGTVGMPDTWYANVVPNGTQPASIQFPGGGWDQTLTFLNPSPQTGYGVFYSRQGWNFNDVGGTIAPGFQTTPYTVMLDGFPAAPPTFPSTGTQNTIARISVTPGPNQFGGSWDLGVTFNSLLVFATPGGNFLGGPIRVQAQQNAPYNSAAIGRFHFTGNPLTNTPVFSTTTCPSSPATCPWAGATLPQQVEIDGVPYTTGMVTIRNLNVQVPTLGPTNTLSDTGADNRTGTMSSMGTLQLVAANINSIRGVAGQPGKGFVYTDIEFLPEPSSTVAFLFGISGLALLSRGRRSRE